MPLKTQRSPLAAEESADGSLLQQVRRWLTLALSLLRRGADRVGALLLTATVRGLNAFGLLDDAGELLIGLLVKRGKLGPLTDAQRRTVRMVKDSIYARLVVEGYLATGPAMSPTPSGMRSTPVCSSKVGRKRPVSASPTPRLSAIWKHWWEPASAPAMRYSR